MTDSSPQTRDILLTGADGPGWGLRQGRADVFAVSPGGRRLYLFSVETGDTLSPLPDTLPPVIAVPALDAAILPLTDRLPEPWEPRFSALLPGVSAGDPAFLPALAEALRTRWPSAMPGPPSVRTGGSRRQTADWRMVSGRSQQPSPPARPRHHHWPRPEPTPKELCMHWSCTR